MVIAARLLIFGSVLYGLFLVWGAVAYYSLFQGGPRKKLAQLVLCLLWLGGAVCEIGGFIWVAFAKLAH